MLNALEFTFFGETHTLVVFSFPCIFSLSLFTEFFSAAFKHVHVCLILKKQIFKYQNSYSFHPSSLIPQLLPICVLSSQTINSNKMSVYLVYLHVHLLLNPPQKAFSPTILLKMLTFTLPMTSPEQNPIDTFYSFSCLKYHQYSQLTATLFSGYDLFPWLPWVQTPHTALVFFFSISRASPS